MNELALFAGCGGGQLATQHLLGWRTVCYVELDAYCADTIRQRIADGVLDDAPIWDDAKTFDARPWRGKVDCVSAGFPCQPFSNAGDGDGATDARNLWPATLRIIGECQPRVCYLENVPALLTCGYAGTVFGQLAACGYDARWDCLPASAIGADHRRDRLWIVAHAIRTRPQGHERRVLAAQQSVARYTSRRNGRTAGDSRQRVDCAATDVCRKADAPAGYVDRLRALGNGWVPCVAAKAFKLLSD